MSEGRMVAAARGLLVVSLAVLTLSFGHLVTQYLKLSESYARLIVK